jgi:hypothetical protein
MLRPRHIGCQPSPGAVGVLALALQSPAIGEERKNYFQDPFMQVTSGLAGCPVPEEPLLTLAEMRAEGHAKVDDVEIVFNELMVGIRGKPKYRTAAP